MANSATVLSDGSLVSRTERALYRVERVFALISGFAVFGLMILSVASVLGKALLNMPVPGSIDWIEQFMPLIAFMGIAYSQRDGAHIRMDMVIGLFRGRALWAVEALMVSLILLLVILLIWGSWAHFMRSVAFVADKGITDWITAIFTFNLSDVLISRDSSMDIALPIWPAKLMVPVAFLVLALRLFLQIICYIRAIITGNPIGIPLIEDVATQAAREAAAMEAR